MQLTDEIISSATDGIIGFIIAQYAEDFELPLLEAAMRFYLSNTYQLLQDPLTGLYWDSIPETYNLFLKEIMER
ncbi:MAG: hypothetical protein LBN08_02290 [Lactobacillales bacterium]|jgi:hypothetical protein|nr:hypothetical protein [Lactobacillales bacterium]